MFQDSGIKMNQNSVSLNIYLPRSAKEEMKEYFTFFHVFFNFSSECVAFFVSRDQHTQ